MTFFKNKYAGLIFNISICLVISCSSYDFSSVFSTLPVKPQAGETVTMLYNPKGTVLVLNYKTFAQVQNFIDKDPYSQVKLFKNVKIIKFKQVI